MEKESFYPIRAVAKLVGMTTDSIRAWERRHQAISPARGAGGRLYSDLEVQRLMLLKQAVDHGHSIGQIARLDNSALQNLPMENAAENERGRQYKRMEERELNRVIAYLEDYDATSADRLLGSLAVLQPPRDFVYSMVLPLMRMVGTFWHKGTMTVAQEHMLSSILRNLLGTLLRTNNKQNTPRTCLFTTLPGERHEFGILSAAMLTAGSGLKAIYLGPDLPLEDTLIAVQKTGAKSLVLAMFLLEEMDDEHLHYLRALNKALPADVEVILGGKLTDRVGAEARTLGFTLCREMKEMEAYLEKQGGVF